MASSNSWSTKSSALPKKEFERDQVCECFFGDRERDFDRHGCPLDGAKVMLFTNSPALGLDTVTGDLTVPTFTGYAAATVTFEEAVDDTGRKYLIIPPEIFSPTNATNLPQTIMGAAVTDDANAYLFGGYFDTPVILAFPTSSCTCRRNASERMRPDRPLKGTCHRLSASSPTRCHTGAARVDPNGLSLQMIRAAARELLQVVEEHREQVWNEGNERDLMSLQGFVEWFGRELRKAAGLKESDQID